MMKRIDKRIHNILESTKGSQRAKPKTDLFAKVEQQIYGQGATIIPIRQLKLVVAAAVLLLLINGLAITTFLNQDTKQSEYAEPLIMDYKLYD